MGVAFGFPTRCPRLYLSGEVFFSETTGKLEPCNDTGKPCLQNAYALEYVEPDATVRTRKSNEILNPEQYKHTVN